MGMPAVKGSSALTDRILCLHHSRWEDTIASSLFIKVPLLGGREDCRSGSDPRKWCDMVWCVERIGKMRYDVM
jgi:hypothetical protein